MKTLKSFLLLLLILIFLTGCGNALYISKLGWHQAYVTFHSIPIQEVLEDEEVNTQSREKIRLIQEVKRYGEEKLGLKKTKSYSKYFEIKGPILYVITACEKDRLQFYHWTFPIAGQVTYKSFFTKEGVLKEKNQLDKKGYDTFVQQAAAYSTLGWLKDPIFSPMLDWSEAFLTNLILHEMTHASVYFKGDTDFNEQIATFIGNRGAIEFLKEKYGEESPEVIEAIHNQDDDLIFSRWIDLAYQRLSAFYAKGISRDEKLRGREEIFQSLKEEFKEMRNSFRTEYYKDFEKTALNNAVILAYRRYIHQLERFEALYNYFGNDLRKVTELIREIRASEEVPSSFLAQWMKKRGIIVPSAPQ